jgi:hypothetical protein
MRGSLLSYALYKTFVYLGKRRGNLRYEDGARLAVGRSLEEGNSVLFDTNPKQRCETSGNTESSNSACLGGFCNYGQRLET